VTTELFYFTKGVRSVMHLSDWRKKKTNQNFSGAIGQKFSAQSLSFVLGDRRLGIRMTPKQ
jgi:hypothetical protein